MTHSRWLVVCIVGLFGCERADQRALAPAAVVIAYSGQELFIGNDELATDEHVSYKGTLRTIQNAFALASPAKELPAGSLGMLISYAEQPTVRLAMQPIVNMTPEAFGKQQDYGGHTGDDMVSAIQLGVDALSTVRTERRILIVIGSGADTNMSTANDRLRAIKPQLDREHIRSYLVVPWSDGPAIAAPDVYYRAAHASSVEGLASELHRAWRGDPR